MSEPPTSDAQQETRTASKMASDTSPEGATADRPIAAVLDSLVTPLAAIELGLTLFATLLELLSFTLFDYRFVDDETPFSVIGMAIAIPTMPVYFVALFGIVRRKWWGR